MTIRLENVGIAVRDLEAAVASFTDLGPAAQRALVAATDQTAPSGASSTVICSRMPFSGSEAASSWSVPSSVHCSSKGPSTLRLTNPVPPAPLRRPETLSPSRPNGTSI